MIRNDVKNALATLLKSMPSVKSAYTRRQKFTDQTQYPSIVVWIPHAKETRVSAQAPVGKKKVTYTVQLDIFNVDTSNDGSGQDTFEDLLDSIDAQLRLNPNLNGIALSMGLEHIDTDVALPQLIGQNVSLIAIKKFDVTVQVNG